MFKLESYIAPLLMGYIDKYVKLQQEDFTLSLWGGDAVLNKLDLRLDAIESALNLPITFKSGHIYELRIHVPWTKLGSEPVVITINTIECILKLRDSASEDAESSSMKSSGSGSRLAMQGKQRPKRQAEADDLPPGYLQSLVNRIVNNVNIVINNLILKFVEDDIVLSVNVKSAECYSVNQDWTRAFIELAIPELVLRRVFDFNDLTICLDKRNASGKIDTYQDPLLYRCSVTCRIHMVYDSLHAKLPAITKFNLLCEKLGLTLTDTQVPMFFRLIELCVAIYYGTLELPGAAGGPPEEGQTLARPTDNQAVGADSLMGAEEEGWASWAWSYVPQILPSSEEEEYEEEARRKKAPPPVLSLGFYINKTSVVFKLTEMVAESGTYSGSGRVTFAPCILWEADGISLEVLIQGLLFFNVQFGVTSTRIAIQGEAMCGVSDVTSTSRNPCFFTSGTRLEVKHQPLIGYMTGSLFDPGGAENQNERPTYIFAEDKHLQQYTETYSLVKFGAFWMDYLFTMDEQDDKGEARSSNTSLSQAEEHVKENSTIRFLFGPTHVIVSSSMVQRLHKFVYCMGCHDYEPYSKPHKEIVDETRAPPSEEQVRALEEYVPTRAYHVTWTKPVIWLQANDLPAYDVRKRKIISQRKMKKTKSKSTAVQAPSVPVALPLTVLQAERVDFQITAAMYPRRLIQQVSKVAAPSSNLLHHCHTHTYIKVFGVQAGIARLESSGQVTPVQNIIQPWSGAWYKRSLLFPMYWKNPLQPRRECMYELPHFTVNFTKPQLLLLLHIGLTWADPNPTPHKLQETSLPDDVFKTSEVRVSRKHPVLEVSISGVEMRECRTLAVWAATGTLTAMQAMVVHLDAGHDSITPLMYGPLETAAVPSHDFFRQLGPRTEDVNLDCITFTIQLPDKPDMPAAPAAFMLDIHGVAGTLDPILYDWLVYTPTPTRVAATHEATKGSTLDPKVSLNPALAQSTSPLKTSVHSQGSQSGSTRTVPTDAQTQSQTMSQTAPRTPSKLDITTEDTGGEDGDASPADDDTGWGHWFAMWFPLIKIMEVQVDVRTCCMFFPAKHVRLTEVAMNIPHNLRACFAAGTLPDTLVVCWPHLHLHSAGHKSTSSVTEIPIKSLEHSVSGERLPWSLQMTQCSTYTLHSSRDTHYLLKPASVSATVAVTTKYHPPTSDNITSLGLCIHADMETVVMTSSQRQILQLYDLTMHIITVGNKLVTSIHQQMATVMRTEKTPSATSAVSAPPSSIPVRTATNNQTVSTSSQLEPPVTITETSESMSRETTPIRDLEDLSKVKLSLWLQWTLPKLICSVYSKDALSQGIRVQMEVEDVATSVDVQDVYSKVKVKVGALNANHYVKRDGCESWTMGDRDGLLLSCSDELTRNIQIHSNKTWTSHSQPAANLFTAGDLKPRDKTHGFLMVTFTRALRRNVKKRMKKVMLEGIVEDGSPQVAQVYLNEVCVSLQPSQVVLNCPILSHVLKMLISMPPRGRDTLARSSDQARHCGASNWEKVTAPLLTSSFLPLIYINATNFRLCIPKCDAVAKQRVEGGGEKKGQTPEKGHGFADGLQHDVYIVQLRALTLTPQADNPLPRVVVEKDLYRRAIHAGMVYQPGSEVEDRQYQLDMVGLSLSTGRWRDLVVEATTKVDEKLTVQHPALEWNNLMSQRSQKDEVRLIPIANAFDLRIVAAPAIVYTPPATETEAKEPILVCGYSVEMNATSDMDFYLSNSQVKLALDILETNMVALMGVTMATATEKGKVNRERVREERKDESHLHDSGVESETSTFIARQPSVVVTTCEPSTLESEELKPLGYPDLVPFDLLLTAGKISFMTYMHREGPVPRQRKTSERLPSACEFPLKDQTPPMQKTDVDFKSIGLQNGPILPLTLTAADSGIDLGSQGSGEGQVVEERLKGVVHVVPFLYATFAQPHTMVMMQGSSQKVELSCYDVVLKGAKEGYSFTDDLRIIPDVSDFGVHWIETKPGEVNMKTGIPPSLYTLRATDFLHQPAEVLIQLQRPLKLNVSISQVQQLMEFVNDLLPSVTRVVTSQMSDLGKDQRSHKEKQHEQTPRDPSSSQPPELLKALTRIRSVQLQTVQTLVALETVTHEKTPAVQLSVSAIECQLDILAGDTESVSELSVSLGVTDFLIKTCYAHKWRPLIGPFPVTINLNAQWMAHSGPAYLPSLLCFLEAGVVTVMFGQEHVMCLQLLLDHVSQYLKSFMEKSKGTEEPVHNDLQKHDVRVCPDLETSTDDLRAGQFTYNTNESGPEVLPVVHEIVFSVDYDDGHATMTWCYPEPRILTFIQVTPVPFSLPQELDARFIDEDLKVPCLLQYWHPLRRDYVDYATFSLSENQATSVDLPEVTFNEDVRAAQVWRALILHPRDKQELVEIPEDVSEENLEPLVSPMTLAASLRVDSCYTPSLVPLLQMALSASTLQFRLSSHLKHLGCKTPNKLAPYKLDQTYGCDDHEFAILTLDRPALTFVTLAGQHPKVTTQVNTAVQCDIMEYRNLTLRPFVEQVDIDASATLQLNPEQVVFNTEVELAPLYIRLGEGAVHTLSTAAEAWAQVESTVGDHVLPHYYMVCNNTSEMLKITQVGTDEEVRLTSLEVHPYTWRCHKTQQLLQLTLEGLGGQWCEPLDIDVVGVSVRVIEYKGHKVTLIVKVKQLSGVQKQVVVSGQVLVASRLSQHLEVRLLTHKSGGKDDKLGVLSAEGTLPSYVTEHEDVRAVRVRLLGLKTTWSQDVTVTGEKTKENRLVKVPLADRGSFIHVWCHIFTQAYEGATQILVIFTPLFVARTHLPSTLGMNVETSRLKSHYQVELQGQGHEEHIHMIGGDMTHNITFQLSSSQKPSSPAIALSSGMIEQVPKQSLDQPDVDQLMYDWMEDCSQQWPYNNIEEALSPEPLKPPISPSGNKQKVQEVVMQTPSGDSLMKQPNIDLQICLQQRWVGCNTLLINITPNWLLVNDTHLDLMVIENNEQQWRLPRKQTFAPPVFREAFRLGLVLDNRMHLSDPLTLSEQDTPFRYLQGDEDVLYRQGHIKVTIPVVIGNNINKLCYVTLHSTCHHAMRVVTVRETFVLANVSRADLQVQCFTLPLSKDKVSLDHDAAVTLDSKFDMGNQGNHPVCPLPFWTRAANPDQSETSSQETTDVTHVQYLCLRHVTADAAACHWALPCRVRATENGVRTNVSLPYDGLTYSTRSCVVTAQQRAGMTYLTVVEDREPSIELHNNCNFTVAYGQTLMGVTSEGITVQEEAELTTHIPMLPPGGSSFYTFPACNSHFPDITPPADSPKLHLSGFHGDGLGTQKLYWSNGIDVKSEHDIFVHIPELSDVKVHIEKVGHTTHIFIDPVSRAEISAKEIRSRIRGKETIVVLETKKEKLVEKESRREGKTEGEALTRSESLSAVRAMKPTPLRPFLMKVIVVCKNACFILLDESSLPEVTSELLRATATNLCALYYPSDLYDPFRQMRPHVRYSLGVSCGDLQIDNQMYGIGNYDFPVIFLKQAHLAEPDFGDKFFCLSSAEQFKEVKQRSLLTLQMALCTDLRARQTSMLGVSLTLKPVSVCVEDTFVYDILDKMSRFVRTKLSHDKQEPIRELHIPRGVWCTAMALSHPIRMDHLTIEPIELLLSVHASLKLFIASDNSPLSFSKFAKDAICTNASQLVRAVAMHYASGALYRAGWVVGSLEILGNPTGLVRNVGLGVTDLFRLPYEGLTRGPGAFVGGVTRGMGSLVRHISTGALTSVTNFASSMSRNMDRLSLDSAHRQRQEESRRHKPRGVSDGLMQGLAGFGISVLGAIAGIADQPLQSLTSTGNTPKSPGRHATGIVSGVGKGLVGAFTKPIGGAAELVSQTGMGLLHGAGLTSIPSPRHAAVKEQNSGAVNTNLKFIQKLLPTVPNAAVLAVLDGTQVDHHSALPQPILHLLLTPEILFLVSTQEDTTLQAYAISEISCHGHSNDASVLYVSLCGKQESSRDGDTNQNPWLVEFSPPSPMSHFVEEQVTSKDKVAAFIGVTSSYSALYSQATNGQSETSSAMVHLRAPGSQLEFQVDVRMRDLFLAQFRAARRKALGQGFPV